MLNILEAPLLGFILAYLIRYIADPESDIYIFRENVNIPPYIFMGIIVALFFGLIVSAEEIFKDAKILKREAFLNLSRSSYLVSKVLILFTLSAIQMILFVAVANYILEIKNMTFEFWLALFSISAFANILGLIISASFNSIITIYILIPLLMIPQMVLGGAMFTFDKLNKDFTSVDKVPFVAEWMPSRWIYEGLIVHQYKHNNFKKNIFDIELIESKADFKQVYYIPELQDILASCKTALTDESKMKDKTFISDMALLKNEITKENKRVVEALRFKEVENLSPDKFNEQTATNLSNYLNVLKQQYGKMFFAANGKKEKFIEANIRADKQKFERIRDEHFNESISDIVRKVFEKNKMLRDGDKLVQMIDPIYQIPEPKNSLDFRTHFFAPQKHIFGTFYDTLWFNISIVWILTILLYAVLYYDLLRKGLTYMGELKLRKR